MKQEKDESVAKKKNIGKKEKEPRNQSQALVFIFGSGDRIRTDDLWVMSPTSYQTAPPRANYVRLII